MSDQFPVYLKVENDLAGISAFERAMESATQKSKRAFERNFDEIGKIIQQGLAKGVNAAGNLDLNVGQFRQAAAEARVYSEALSATLRTAQALAVETKDTSEATRLYLQSLSAQRVEADKALSTANSQVATYTRLQTALDATSSNVSRLKEAYRGLYAEQAKAAAFEVNSFAALQDKALEEKRREVERRRPARESASVFETQAYAPKADARGGLDRLLAGSASIDKAVLSATTLEQVLGRVATKGAAVTDELQRVAGVAAAAAAEQVRAADEVAAAEARAAAAKAQYAQAADRLRAQLDPMFGAQQRFNSALDQADLLFKQGAITAREYEAANALARQELQEHARTVAGVVTAEQNLERVRKQGTTANQAVVNSARASRQAYVQLGQQLQDVAIQAQLGTNPLIILTQQGSQAAFALSGMGGKLGTVASFLAGPWGAAVFGAVTVVSLLTAAFKDNADAAEGVKAGSNAMADAQSALSGVFDKTSGAIGAQNELLRINARLLAVNLRADAVAKRASSADGLKRAGQATFSAFELQALDLNVGPTGGQKAAQTLKKLVADVRAGKVSAEAGIKQAEKFDFSRVAVSKDTFIASLRDTIVADLNDKAAALIDKSLDSNTNLLSKGGGGRGSGGGRGRSGGGGAGGGNSPATRLQEFGEDTADKIARINDQFADTPKAIERANQAMRTLDDLADDIQRKNPANADKLLAGINKAKGAINDSLVRPFEDYMKAAREASAVDELRAQGREDEALAMSDILRLQEQMGPLTDKQKNDILATVVAERQRAAVIRDTQAIMQEYAQSIQNVRSALEQTIGNALRGKLSLTNILSSVGNSYINLLQKSITEKLFGSMFRDLEDQVNGSDVVKRASEDISTSLYDGRAAVLDFGAAITRVTEFVNGVPNPAAVGLRDPGSLVDGAGNVLWGQEGDIVVNGRPAGTPSPRGMMTPERFVTGVLEGFIGKLGIRLPKTLGESLQKAAQGAAYGQVGGGIVSMLGGRSSGAGASIGGALGETVFKKLAPNLFKKLGDFAGPLGSIAGGILGGLVGGLFGSTPKGVATIGGSGGNLKVASLTGNSSKMKQAAGNSADSAITTLEGIAEQLGGTLNASRGSVSIGVRKGQYFIDPTGRGAVKEKKGAIGFGEDAAAAIKAAALDLIKDGVIEGLRAGTQRLLQSGKDLEAAVAKAAKFESVFTRLKSYTDPVGAAIDTVDKEFRSLKKIFDEAGASASEYADLEKLYQKERAKAVEEASSAMTSALRGLLDELKTGDNGRSLRDRLSSALEAYNPLASDLQAGKQVDYDKFAEAARTVLDIQRQIDGSQSAYFTRLDEITNLTAKALSDQENVISIAAGRVSAVGTSATTEPTYTPVVDALGSINANLTSLLGAVNQNLGQLIRSSGGGTSDFAYTAQSLRF